MCATCARRAEAGGGKASAAVHRSGLPVAASGLAGANWAIEDLE